MEEDDDVHTVPLKPLKDHTAVLNCIFQKAKLEVLNGKRRLSASDRQLQKLHSVYGTVGEEGFHTLSMAARVGPDHCTEGHSKMRLPRALSCRNPA